MSVIVTAERGKKDVSAMRDAYVKTLIRLAKTNREIVTLDADLSSCIGMERFAAEYPKRFINCGIQEANMMGVAAGLAAVGKVPFVHTFGPFATRRSFDQVFISIAYAGLSVRIIGSDPGVTAAFNGGTHMPFEDGALMRTVPGATVADACDCVQMEALTSMAADNPGLTYIRMPRKDVMKVYEAGSEFTFGKANELRDGEQVTIIASGILVDEALQAADLLAGEGISAAVLDMFTWKPLDTEAVAKWAAKTGALVTAENHNIIGGLGSAVAEAVCELCPVPVERVGALDRFDQVGPQAFLMDEYNMRAADIAAAAKRAIARKRA